MGKWSSKDRTEQHEAQWPVNLLGLKRGAQSDVRWHTGDNLGRQRTGGWAPTGFPQGHQCTRPAQGHTLQNRRQSCPSFEREGGKDREIPQSWRVGRRRRCYGPHTSPQVAPFCHQTPLRVCGPGLITVQWDGAKRWCLTRRDNGSDHWGRASGAPVL